MAERGGSADGDAVVMQGISKRFPGMQALDGVDLDLRRGEIHALCGGNGSGKSTLIKILAGVEAGESGGTIRVGDVEAPADSWSASLAAHTGVRTVHQDLGVFPALTVAENMALGRGFETDRTGRVRWRQVKARAAQLIERFEIAARPDSLMGSLSRGAQTQVAIARALQDQGDRHTGVLILDEATAALPAHEVELLLAALRRYAAQGLSILFVSHRLDEVLGASDRATFLRDGRTSGTFATATLSEARLIELIVGRQVDRVFPRMPEVVGDDVVLEVDGLCAGPLEDVSFTVKRGEVLGIAGLLGSGRTELLQALFGDLRVVGGAFRLDGRPCAFRHPRDAMAAGVAFVPESREEAAFRELPVSANLSAAVLDRYWKGMRLRERSMRRDATKLMGEYGVKAASARAPIGTLSGGNQQKVILARWLRRSPRLLLLDEPTQGVDVGARADIYRMVRAAVADGAAALIVSSDLEELSHVVDRAVVLRNGRVQGEVPREDLDPERLTQLSYAEEN